MSSKNWSKEQSSFWYLAKNEIIEVFEPELFCGQQFYKTEF